MLSIKLPDNSIRNFDNPLTIEDVAKDIGAGLGKPDVKTVTTFKRGHHLGRALERPFAYTHM